MTICRYCFKKGMTIDEYENFANNIKLTAKAIRTTLNYNNGMYFETKDIFNCDINIDIKGFIINELKNLDIEFIEDYKMYRVVS